MKTIAAVVIVVLLTGCTPVKLDPIMGRTDGTAIPAPPPKLDCDLIFPGPSVDP